MSHTPDEREDPAATASATDRRAARPRGLPWTRGLLMLAVVGPALYLGGTRSETVVGFLVVMAALWVRLTTRSRAALEVPWVAWAGVGLVALTLLQWAPIPGLREAVAPAIAAQVDTALAGTGVMARPGLTVSAPDTGLEGARLVGLLALFIAAAQLSWRTSAALAAAVGSVVALIGFGHAVFGLDAIYGRYSPQDIDLSSMPSLITTFVNPNHQSSLLLLGLFCAGGLALDQHVQALGTRDPAKVDQHGDRMLAAMAAITVQLPALILSLSRGAIVTLLVLAPVALWLVWRRDPNRRPRRKRQRHLSPLRYIGLSGLGLLLLLVAQHGAWRELGTLSELWDPHSSTRAKLRAIAEAHALIPQSPWLGTGRGTFIDLFGPIDSAPTHVLQTHLESAPVVAIVEWGPAVGTALLLAGLAWAVGAWRRDPTRRDAPARRIACLGVIAVGLHNTLDFSLEFLGVTAPCIAVAGGLSSNVRGLWNARVAAFSLGAALLGALWLAFVSYPHTFARRDADDRAMLAGRLRPSDVLPLRPLDGRLHRQLARRAAAAGDWELALHHALVATERRPGAVDGWLLLASAYGALHRPREAAAAAAAALERLHQIPGAETIHWLVTTFPRGADLGAIAPTDPQAWHRLMDALAEHAPAHADAVAAVHTATDPDDPAPLRYRTGLALAAGQPALALHHARLWRAAVPHEAASHQAVASALRSFDPPRLREARDALEEGLARGDLDDPGAVEEQLVRTLLDLGDETSRTRARAVADALLARTADRASQQRRAALAKALDSSPPK
jgi:hypothetical protein